MVKPVATMDAVATVRASTTVETTAVETTTAVHLRASDSDTSKSRARRDTCYCEFSH